MNPKITTPVRRPGWQWWFAFVLLILVVHEAHELAHTITGRFLCGQWAVRDFNSWNVPGCDSLWPTAAGPVFSYALMWLGLVLMGGAGPSRGLLALALIFAANPFARLFTVAMGGGDEMVLVRLLTSGAPAWRVAAVCTVVALTLPPMWAGWAATRGWSRRWVCCIALTLAGIGVTGVVLMLGFNRLLRAGVMTEVVSGAPMLVHVVTLVAVAGLLAWMPWLWRSRPV